jgi:hypothetical protein
MNRGPLTKVKAAKAAEICRQFELKEEARPLLQDRLTPREFLDALLAERQYQAAIPFVAHALPAREAIWWGCLCLRHVTKAPLPPPEEAACRAAVQWVLEPTEENRREALAPGQAAGVGTPAGALALAASWTGGSLSPPNLPPVPPSPSMPAKGVAGAVLLAAAKAEPTRIADTQRLFVELGMELAEGRVVCPEARKKTPGRA